MTDKALIFDSGTLISFSMNGLTDLIKKLKENFKGYFLITNDVKREIIDKPITIKRFELEALKLKQLLDEGILQMPSVIGIKDNEINKKVEQVMNLANNAFVGDRDSINLIACGEASCFALSGLLTERKIKNVVAIDERTARSLAETPKDLAKFLGKKLHTKITSKQENYSFFNQFKIIRSAELAYVAYKKGLVNLKNGQVLDALLYAMKFKGCAISSDEISEMKKIK